MQDKHVSNLGEDWSRITTKEERKRVQNRLNQRARRNRIQKEKSAEYSDTRPFRVHRWRANGSSTTPTVTKPLQVHQRSWNNGVEIKLDAPGHDPNTAEQIESDVEYVPHPSFPPLLLSGATSSMQSHLQFPISSDHLLLHLVHYNVFRALTTNKALLAANASVVKPIDQGFIPLLPNFTQFCDGLTIVNPRTDKSLPQSLFPTTLQKTMPHSSWINMFPFPRFRDNLITWEGIFDAQDLCNDLFGDIFTNVQVSSPTRSLDSMDSVRIVSDQESDESVDELNVGRRGMIVWGEPWDKNGWELTPSFVRKWPQLLEGCEDLIGSANQWRAKRDEGPLLLDICSDSTGI